MPSLLLAPISCQASYISTFIGNEKSSMFMNASSTSTNDRWDRLMTRGQVEALTVAFHGANVYLCFTVLLFDFLLVAGAAQ